MNYRSITPDKGKWPQWLRNLAGKSGVYVIRRRRGGRPLYVGESHTGNLKRTLQRHFWAWGGKTAGVTYSPAACEVGVEVLPRNRAVARQNALIKSLQPRDNDLSPLETKERDENPF